MTLSLTLIFTIKSAPWLRRSLTRKKRNTNVQNFSRVKIKLELCLLRWCFNHGLWRTYHQNYAMKNNSLLIQFNNGSTNICISKRKTRLKLIITNGLQLLVHGVNHLHVRVSLLSRTPYRNVCQQCDWNEIQFVRCWGFHSSSPK